MVNGISARNAEVITEGNRNEIRLDYDLCHWWYMSHVWCYTREDVVRVWNVFDICGTEKY